MMGALEGCRGMLQPLFVVFNTFTPSGSWWSQEQQYATATAVVKLSRYVKREMQNIAESCVAKIPTNSLPKFPVLKRVISLASIAS